MIIGKLPKTFKNHKLIILSDLVYSNSGCIIQVRRVYEAVVIYIVIGLVLKWLMLIRVTEHFLFLFRNLSLWYKYHRQ